MVRGYRLGLGSSPRGARPQRLVDLVPYLAWCTRVRDDARSEAAYSFAELRRLRSPDGVYDPIERLPSEGGVTESAPAEESQTPGFGVAAAALALAGVAAFVRRRR